MPKLSDQTNGVNFALEQAIHAILGDRPIAYHAALAKSLGSVTAGVLLSQFLYWQPRSRDADGWFWKTRDEIYEETALGRREQETARKILRAASVLEEQLKGVPARMHFRVNITELVSLLSQYQESGGSSPDKEEDPRPGRRQSAEQPQLGGNAPSSWAESAQLVGRKPTNKNARKRPTITETTTETTPENTSETTISNSFDRFAILQQIQTRSVFSKKRNKVAKTLEYQLKEEGRRRREGDRDEMTAIGHIISRRRTATPEHAPVTPATAPESAPNPRNDAEHHPEPYEPPERPRRGRPPKLPPYLEDLVDRYSAELHDDDHVAQNRGQAARLWKASGYSEARFGQVLAEAKAVTLERDIRKRATVGGEFGWRNKMPYLFTVLRDLLGTTDAEARGGEP